MTSESIALTDVANPKTTKMAEKGCIWDKCSDEDQSKERSGPCRDSVRANSTQWYQSKGMAGHETASSRKVGICPECFDRFCAKEHKHPYTVMRISFRLRNLGTGEAVPT